MLLLGVGESILGGMMGIQSRAAIDARQTWASLNQKERESFFEWLMEREALYMLKRLIRLAEADKEAT